jgi:hypothetical protein
MKLVLCRFGGITRLGAPVGDYLVDLTRAAERVLQAARGTPRPAALAALRLPPSVVDFLAGGPDALELARVVFSATQQVDSDELKRTGIYAAEAEVESCTRCRTTRQTRVRGR